MNLHVRNYSHRRQNFTNLMRKDGIYFATSQLNLKKIGFLQAKLFNFKVVKLKKHPVSPVDIAETWHMMNVALADEHQGLELSDTSRTQND